jgi:hypothetical protein
MSLLDDIIAAPTMGLARSLRIETTAHSAKR